VSSAKVRVTKVILKTILMSMIKVKIVMELQKLQAVSNVITEKAVEVMDPNTARKIRTEVTDKNELHMAPSRTMEAMEVPKEDTEVTEVNLMVILTADIVNPTAVTEIPTEATEIPTVDTVAPMVDMEIPTVDTVAHMVDMEIPTVDTVDHMVDMEIPTVDTVAHMGDTEIPTVDTLAPMVDTVDLMAVMVDTVDLMAVMVEATAKDTVILIILNLTLTAMAMEVTEKKPKSSTKVMSRKLWINWAIIPTHKTITRPNPYE